MPVIGTARLGRTNLRRSALSRGRSLVPPDAVLCSSANRDGGASKVQKAGNQHTAKPWWCASAQTGRHSDDDEA
jgi:hypothetical protein